MRRLSCLLLSLASILPAVAQLQYPPTRKVDAVDTYFGKDYKDPYRWLEQLKEPEVAAWFKAQATLTDQTLDTLPGREALVRQWTELDKLKPANFSGIRFEGGHAFYKKTLGGENVGKLYFRMGWTGKEQLLFDPTTFQPGRATTLQSYVPSKDGKRVALALSAGGAEVSEIRVLEVATRRLLADRIEASYGPFEWARDNRSFFYDSGPGGDPQSVAFHLHRKARLHRLGTDPKEDRDLFSDAYPELGLSEEERPMVFIDATLPHHLLANTSIASNDVRFFYAPDTELGRPQIHWKAICERKDGLTNVAFHGDQVYATTYVGAPKYKVVRTNLRHPDWAHAETILPEGKDAIQDLVSTKDFIFVVYSDGMQSSLSRIDCRTGRITKVPLPRPGVVGFYVPDPGSNRCLVTLNSWTLPPTVYEIDAAHPTFVKSTFNADVSYPGFEDFVVEEVEVPSHDGVMVPLSILHKKGMTMDGSHSCIFEGYGSYGYSFSPRFSILRSILSQDVVLAFAHVRGGGEKGEAWHRAGMKTTKPNTWKDFIACAEYLVGKGYTSAKHLAGTGTSAGGILISRAVTARPDLFAAAVCNVGDADAMRAEFGTDGPANAAEYGSVKNQAECEALFEMDGMLHVTPGVAYPAVLGVGGWNDPRVAPWQTGKFIAALQQATTGARPILMKVNYDNGHFTEEKTVTFRNFASQYAFMLWQTGHKAFQPKP